MSALGIGLQEKHMPVRAQLTSHPPPPLTSFILPPGPPWAQSEATCKALCTHFSLLLCRQIVTTFYLQAPWELPFGSRILIIHRFETMNPAFLMKRNGILISVIYLSIIGRTARHGNGHISHHSSGFGRGHVGVQGTHKRSFTVTFKIFFVFKSSEFTCKL